MLRFNNINKDTKNKIEDSKKPSSIDPKKYLQVHICVCFCVGVIDINTATKVPSMHDVRGVIIVISFREVETNLTPVVSLIL